MTTQPVNIVSAEFKADPFPFLAHLRASDPVYRTALSDKTSVWLITRYDDVNALLRDQRFTKHRRIALTKDEFRKLPWTPRCFDRWSETCLTSIRPITQGCVH